jgi:hypothetical protein
MTVFYWINYSCFVSFVVPFVFLPTTFATGFNFSNNSTHESKEEEEEEAGMYNKKRKKFLCN